MSRESSEPAFRGVRGVGGGSPELYHGRARAGASSGGVGGSSGERGFVGG